MVARIIWKQPTASGRRTGWAKVVESVDLKLRGAKAFAGPYLQGGIETDLPIGSFILEVRPEGSVKNGSEIARLLIVSDTGTLEECIGDHDWHAQFLSFRDAVAKELAEAAADLADDEADALRGVSDAALLAEVERRGLQIGGAQ